MKALDLIQLNKTYANGVVALRDVDLSVEEGDFYSLLGPNGAGKSTLIGIVSSLVNATSGQASVFGVSIHKQRSRAMAMLGLVPQELNFNQFEKPIDIIVNQAGYYGIKRAEAKLRAAELLKRPRVTASDLVAASGSPPAGEVSLEALSAVEVELKYAGYVAREREHAERLRGQANLLLHNDLPYCDFHTLSFEAREKLSAIRPASLAQAGRIPGISPADLQNLILEVRRHDASPAEDVVG